MNIAQFVGAHLGGVIGGAVAGSSLLTGIAFKFAQSKIPGLVKAQEEKLLDALFSKLKRAEDKAALKAILAAVKVRFPDAGDAQFAMAADACVKDIPALAPYRDSLVKLFTAVEQAADEGLADEAAK
jgi:hypothetical protein